MARASTPLVPRLHVLMRPEAPRAVIIRNGPSKLSVSIGWDLASDQFVVGQMVRARIYPLLSDLSPDGARWYYVAYNGREHEAATQGSYGALARAPYLKALKLWPGTSRFWEPRLFDAAGQLRYCKTRPYLKRLAREGWRVIDTQPGTVRLRKPINPRCALEKLHHHGGGGDRPTCYDTHSLVDRGGRSLAQAWDWCDVRDGRLLWTAAGALHASHRVDDDGHIRSPRVLRDFTDLPWQSLQAPY